MSIEEARVGKQYITLDHIQAFPKDDSVDTIIQPKPTFTKKQWINLI